jgi:hypothetical protein
MKKTLLVVIAAILLGFAGRAQSFDCFSLGIGTGLDGTSFEAATRLGDHVQIRLGYGMAFGLGYTFKDQNSLVSIPEHPGVEGSRYVDVPTKLSFARNDGRLLFNIYPGKRATFHFTFGAYFGSGSFFRAVIKDLPADYDNMGLDMGDHVIKAIDREIRTELRAFGFGAPGFSLMPYAGIGFGRPVRDDKRVTFSFDLGAAYQGEPSLWARSVRSDGTREYIDVTKNDIIDLSEAISEYGQYMNFWPTLNFHLYFRLF